MNNTLLNRITPLARKPVVIILLTITLSILIGWLSDTLYILIDPTPSKGTTATLSQLAPTIAYLAALVLILSIVIYKLGTNFLPVKSLDTSIAPSNKKALLINVSRLEPSQMPIKSDVGWTLAINFQKERCIVPLTRNSIKKDLNATLWWPWAQTIRAIRQHESAIQVIVLFGSAPKSQPLTDIASDISNTTAIPEPGFPTCIDKLKHEFMARQEAEREKPGSYDQCVTLKELLTYLFNNRIQIVIHNEALDFENIDSLYDAYTREIHNLVDSRYGEGIRNKDIIIDVTGGQKTTSIAGALATLHNPEISFQYVQTGKNNNVVAYNCISTSKNELDPA